MKRMKLRIHRSLPVLILSQHRLVRLSVSRSNSKGCNTQRDLFTEQPNKAPEMCQHCACHRARC